METYRTVDDVAEPYDALVGDRKLRFTRALSANRELALEERRARTADQSREVILGSLAHMAPDETDLESLFDLMGSEELLRLLRDAAKALRSVPTIEASASSTPAATAGATGAGEPA
jgi:hypothetical protein